MCEGLINSIDESLMFFINYLIYIVRFLFQIAI